MLSIQILTTIALWCSNPVNATKGAMGFKSGTEITRDEIQDCRESLIKCINETNAIESTECFEKTKIPGD